jgi:hypothetical protein
MLREEALGRAHSRIVVSSTPEEGPVNRLLEVLRDVIVTVQKRVSEVSGQPERPSCWAQY